MDARPAATVAANELVISYLHNPFTVDVDGVIAAANEVINHEQDADTYDCAAAAEAYLTLAMAGMSKGETFVTVEVLASAAVSDALRATGSDSANLALLVRAKCVKADLLSREGHFAQAVAVLKEARESAMRAGTNEQARVELTAGRVALSQRKLPQASQYFSAAMAYIDREGDGGDGYLALKVMVHLAYCLAVFGEGYDRSIHDKRLRYDPEFILWRFEEKADALSRFPGVPWAHVVALLELSMDHDVALGRLPDEGTSVSHLLLALV